MYFKKIMFLGVFALKNIRVFESLCFWRLCFETVCVSGQKHLLLKQNCVSGCVFALKNICIFKKIWVFLPWKTICVFEIICVSGCVFSLQKHVYFLKNLCFWVSFLPSETHVFLEEFVFLGGFLHQKNIFLEIFELCVILIPKSRVSGRIMFLGVFLPSKNIWIMGVFGRICIRVCSSNNISFLKEFVFLGVFFDKTMCFFFFWYFCCVIKCFYQSSFCVLGKTLCLVFCVSGCFCLPKIYIFFWKFYPFWKNLCFCKDFVFF